FGDTGHLTPLLKMCTLGSDFLPPPIHAGGLRYHGASPIVSRLVTEKLVRPDDLTQEEILQAAQIFSLTEGIIPAPESAHAIASAIKEAKKCKENRESKTIVFNLSGHGLLDLASYDHISKINGKGL
ncbi:MAG TPA: TrpB-like pyridoxal-phosphate dependent enzyme, partial [Thermotogota bacterium]|nr:TrpB-like pyridoxal-phosphate dependent enzyme [Thermotogota bacterium]